MEMSSTSNNDMDKKKKKIMLVCNSDYLSQHLKLELELRKVCDVVDIRSVGTNPNKLLEELILQKKDDDEQGDYKLYIIDDSISVAYEFAENLKHNFPKAHLVLLSARGRPRITADIRSNLFYRAYRSELDIERRMLAKMLRKNDAELSETEKRDKAQYQRAVKTEQLGFATNYIKKPIKDYGLAAKKIEQILVTGVYRYEDAAAIKRRLKSADDLRKEKSEKAIRNIMASMYSFPPFGSINKAMSLDEFCWKLSHYGKDVSENEHAAQIVRRLKSYERDAKGQVEEIQKTIREWEDRFPGTVQDPKAFEVAKEAAKEEQDEK
jgi:hypothetical protein